MAPHPTRSRALARARALASSRARAGAGARALARAHVGVIPITSHATSIPARQTTRAQQLAPYIQRTASATTTTTTTSHKVWNTRAHSERNSGRPQLASMFKQVLKPVLRRMTKPYLDILLPLPMTSRTERIALQKLLRLALPRILKPYAATVAKPNA